MHTRVTPEQRHHSMLKFIKNVYANDQARQELTGWGLELDKDLIKVGNVWLMVRETQGWGWS